MADLRIRAYNVLFGDAILITVPDEDETGQPLDRHLLIDVGNALVKGGQNDVFEPIFADIVTETGGTIDLYVSSHEHLDHVQGPLYAHNKLATDLIIRDIWLTASAHDDYYQNHPQAESKHLFANRQLQAIDAGFPAAAREPWLEVLLANNGYPGVSAANHQSRQQCVDFLKTYQNPDGSPCQKSYVHRSSAGGSWPHGFRRATVDVWAPEEDTSVYYGHFQPAVVGAIAGGVGTAGNQDPTVLPPAGVDAESFFNLVDMRSSGVRDALLSIDKAQNNTSVVIHLEWQGWHLLFPGDAEERSYREMEKQGMLGPIHFLKVGHHGSHNGTPPDPLLEMLLPALPADDRDRFAIVSTKEDAYQGVPDDHTIHERVGARASLRDTRSVAPGDAVDVLLPDT